MASYTSFQYSWVLYHDYDCRGAEMLSASHYGRMKWINIPEEAESGVQCACVCVSRQPREMCTISQMHKCWRLHAASPSLLHTHICFNRRAHKYWLLIGTTFLAQEQYIHSTSACDHFLSLSCIGYKLHNTIFLLRRSRQAGQQAGWSQPLARSHLSADLQAVCDRELRCLFRMRSA